jgi:hypothetical protein
LGHGQRCEDGVKACAVTNLVVIVTQPTPHMCIVSQCWQPAFLSHITRPTTNISNRAFSKRPRSITPPNLYPQSAIQNPTSGLRYSPIALNLLEQCGFQDVYLSNMHLLPVWMLSDHMPRLNRGNLIFRERNITRQLEQLLNACSRNFPCGLSGAERHSKAQWKVV